MPSDNNAQVSPSRRWSDMDAAVRHPAAKVTREMIPEEPGVYAWYQGGKRTYVGKADILRDRVWGNHLGQSRSLSDSAFRRNVAEHLGFGIPADIKKGEVKLTDVQLADVRSWIEGCELAWLTCPTAEEALVLEAFLRGEYMPPLNKM